MTEMREDLLNILKENAYRKGEFTLSSGKKTDHYVNCKPVVLHGLCMHFVSTLLLEHVEEDSKAVGGLTLGADPLVCGVAMSSWKKNESKQLNALIVRKEAKGHGTQDYIEGPLPEEGSKVTVLEDVITTGGSAIQAVKRLRDAGYVVNRVVCIVDRQENGEADTALKLAGLELVSLFTLEDLIK
tara:strand:+ start:75 stop:629 length:555 start_codon:yes stop_codon:yes gene_type:complete